MDLCLEQLRTVLIFEITMVQSANICRFSLEEKLHFVFFFKRFSFRDSCRKIGLNLLRLGHKGFLVINTIQLK